MITNTYKYDLGDTVYYLSDGKIYKATIERVDFQNIRNENEVGVTIVVSYTHMTGRKQHVVKQESLFSTREEAAITMLRNAGIECTVQIKEIGGMKND